MTRTTQKDCPMTVGSPSAVGYQTLLVRGRKGGVGEVYDLNYRYYHTCYNYISAIYKAVVKVVAK